MVAKQKNYSHSALNTQHPTVKGLMLLLLMVCSAFTSVSAQDDDDDDIWRNVNLGEVDYHKQRSYAVRLYGYYRYIDDGRMELFNREFKLYGVYEGIFQLDIRYSKDEDDGALVIVGRDMVHAEKPGRFMDFYELKPYTFLEKARRDTRHFTIDQQGDTSRVYARNKLMGTAVRDTLNHELRMHYNALAPDSAYHINMLIINAWLRNVTADAVYRIDDNSIDYVPQGCLKSIAFDGDIDLNVAGGKNTYHENTVIYVDSVVYMSRDEYRADRRLNNQQRRELSGYTMADIDRLRQKYGVPPLTDEQRRLIEEQRDWDDMYEQWKNSHSSSRQ